jgi:predicted site-specific integrase-resolvase
LRIAIYLQVSDATVRSWASRGHIALRTADNGSTMFLASEVWEYAETHFGLPTRCATAR